MRILDVVVPPGSRPTPRSKIGKTLIQRARDWPHPEISVPLIAVLNFPNDGERRNAFLAAFNLAYGLTSPPRTVWGLPDWTSAGEEFIDLLDTASIKAQSRWIDAGDILVSLFALARSTDDRLRGGASVWKAQTLVEIERGNRDQLARNWAAYSDVAHFAAASAYIARLGQTQVGEHPAITLETPILADPITVLQLAAGFQEFGLNTRAYSRADPFLRPESLWRVPKAIEALEITPPSLGEATVNAIVHAAEARRVKRKRRLSSQT